MSFSEVDLVDFLMQTEEVINPYGGHLNGAIRSTIKENPDYYHLETTKERTRFLVSKTRASARAIVQTCKDSHLLNDLTTRETPVPLPPIKVIHEVPSQKPPRFKGPLIDPLKESA